MDTRAPVQPWAGPPGLLLGCLCIAVSFAVLIITLSTDTDRVVSPAEEMGIAAAAVAHANAATPAR
ncbi:MAG TPA: hypothetical protein VMT03_16665 [Polyangia bacterium]|nr:hypothetical protein [Polyangia bacterium]